LTISLAPPNFAGAGAGAGVSKGEMI
jgi:hypothetical protein